MILCDYKIQEALNRGLIGIDPVPLPTQFDSTALNLRVGDDFHQWKPVLGVPGFASAIELETINLSDLLPLTEAIEPVDGFVLIKPNDFVLVRTLETVKFPLEGKLAARVEGRSTLARLGLSVHITAPTAYSNSSSDCLTTCRSSRRSMNCISGEKCKSVESSRRWRTNPARGNRERISQR